MSVTGIVKGVVKTVKGVAEGDVVKVAEGVLGTAVSAVSIPVEHAIHEEVGKWMSEAGESLSDDDDPYTS